MSDKPNGKGKFTDAVIMGAGLGLGNLLLGIVLKLLEMV